MSESLPKRLLRLSEAADGPVLLGIDARSYSKAEFERLLNRRVLVERSPATDWPVCDACECDLDARPIHRVNGKIVAPCPLDARSDAELAEDDLRAFELDVTTLIETLAADNDIADRPNRLLPGLWHLGSVPLAGGNRRALFFARALTQDLLDAVPGAIKAVARVDPPTLLVPAGPSPVVRRRLEEAGIAIVVVEDALAGDAPTKPFRLDPLHLAPVRAEGIRLELLCREKAIRLDGINVVLSGRSFTLVETLVRALKAGNALVVNDKLAQKLRAGAVPNHKVIADALYKLESRLEKSGIDPQTVDGLVANQKSVGYLLTLRADQVVIRD